MREEKANRFKISEYLVFFVNHSNLFWYLESNFCVRLWIMLSVICFISILSVSLDNFAIRFFRDSFTFVAMALDFESKFFNVALIIDNEAIVKICFISAVTKKPSSTKGFFNLKVCGIKL